jgi:hypothetical protein
MTPEERNPAAFPFKSIDFEASAEAKTNIYDGYSQGMTLRDYFAAKAMDQVIFSWRNFNRVIDFEDRAGDAENIAKNCYLLADAMLKARQL